jgi:hypothetical protein
MQVAPRVDKITFNKSAAVFNSSSSLLLAKKLN